MIMATIPANIEHWHGAAPKSWFSHLAIECDRESLPSCTIPSRRSRTAAQDS